MATSLRKQYDADFYAWANETVHLLKEGRFAELDIAHLAEEVESMGRSDKRELSSRLAILIAHLLKWQCQPERRGNSWKYTIKEQRFEIADLLEESPSLRAEIATHLGHAYEKALLIALKETGLSAKLFPLACPFTLTQILDFDFLAE